MARARNGRLDPLEARRLASGCCIRCGGPAGVPKRTRASGRAPGGLVCRTCLDRRAAQANSQARRRAEAGLCARCQIALVNFNFLECERCRSRSRRWWAKRNDRPLPEILPPQPKPPRTLIRSAGMEPQQLRAVTLERVPGYHADRLLPNRPEKPCSNCGRSFAPTLRRRLLCDSCYRGGDGGPMAA